MCEAPTISNDGLRERNISLTDELEKLKPAIQMLLKAHEDLFHKI